MAEPERAVAVPHALDDVDAGGLLPPALGESCGSVDTVVEGEKLGSLDNVCTAVAVLSALSRGLAVAIPVPTSVAAGDRLCRVGVLQALGVCDCGALLSAVLGEGCESDEAVAAAATVTPELTDA